MRQSHERRALGALLFLVPRSAPASTDSRLLSGCGGARRLRSPIVVVFIHRTTHWSLLVHLCVPRTAVITASAQWHFHLLERPMTLCDLEIRWTESSDYEPQPDLSHRILKWGFIPSSFAISDCKRVRRPIHLSDRKVIVWTSESDGTMIGLVCWWYSLVLAGCCRTGLV